MSKGKKKDKPAIETDTETEAEKFDLDNPELPPWIADNAFRSGGYPYDSKMPRKAYDRELLNVQTELNKVQDWAAETGERIVVICEGRDAAGKGGVIKRYMEHLNPRRARIVALPKPTSRERGQWYFQRYVEQLPTAGEITLFDRSWYNRAGVEPVMGFCTREETAEFLEEAPNFEAMLVRSGIKLFKYWLTVGREEQLRRLHARRHDPLKRWKLSPIDLKAIGKWDEYTRARQTMFMTTDTTVSPWVVVKSNDKRRARINCIRHFLSSLHYAEKDSKALGKIDDAVVGSAFQDMD